MLNNKIHILKFIVIIISFCILLFSCQSTKSIKEKYSDDWAMYNFGQDISGSKGIKGIDLNVISAWNISQGDNIIIAVIDSGVDTSVEILKENIYYNKNENKDGIDEDNNGYIDDVVGWDFYNNDNTIYDNYLYDYHGTYISTSIIKVAPKAIVLPIKFIESSSGNANNAVKAIQYAIDMGAQIINCSWNFNEYNKELYRIVKDNPNILFVCAAGNSNINLDKDKLYMCSFELDNIISVLAIDNKGIVYDSSGYGSKVTIGAPGVDCKIICPENDETYISGTSIASAYVSAASAIILSEDQTLKPNEIKEILVLSASKINSLKKLCEAQGYVNISNALNFAKKY